MSEQNNQSKSDPSYENLIQYFQSSPKIRKAFEEFQLKRSQPQQSSNYFTITIQSFCASEPSDESPAESDDEIFEDINDAIKKVLSLIDEDCDHDNPPHVVYGTKNDVITEMAWISEHEYQRMLKDAKGKEQKVITKVMNGDCHGTTYTIRSVKLVKTKSDSK